MGEEKSKSNQSLQISVNLDTTPILYTDNINLMANPEGVMLEVTQRVGPTNQIRIVARVGMSREHARKFVKKLNGLLDLSEGQIETGKGLIN